MADQEFLASFGVEIDESGLDKLQKALKQNRTLAEELASAFDSARSAVSEFFKQLSASTLPSGELSPYQRLMEMSEKGISFSMDLDTTDADGTLRAFMENAQQFFDSTPLPLTADESPLVSVAEETLFMLQALYGEILLPLVADASAVISAGQEALAQLQSMFASTRLTVNATVSISGGFPGLPQKAATGGRFSSPTMTEIAEDGESFEENSLIKASVPASLGYVGVADDSGLSVDALGGAPGVFSARYSGEGATDARNRAKLLEALADVPEEKRTARFVCIMTLVASVGASNATVHSAQRPSRADPIWAYTQQPLARSLCLLNFAAACAVKLAMDSISASFVVTGSPKEREQVTESGSES